jgi:hypothetical protein
MRSPATAIVRLLRARRSFVLVCALLCVGTVALPALARQGGNQTVDVSTSGFGAEKAKTIPIARKSGGKTRVVMSLPPSEVGPIGRNDAVWAGAEVEVSVTCMERLPQCVGSIYHYSPHIKAKLVLAPTADARGESNTVPISRAFHLRCSQELPHRNHHCVLTVQGTRQIKDGENVPCSPCFVNLVLDAYHSSAHKGDVIVIGSDDDDGISQDKGMVNVAVFDPGPPPKVPRVASERSATGRAPVAGAGGNGEKKVIYSRRLAELKAGEQLIVTAKAVQKIGHLPYNVLMQSQLVLSEKPNSVSHRGIPNKIASLKGAITAQNGFNCTQGKSGHRNPCAIRKVGIVRLSYDSRAEPVRGQGPSVPLYVNLVVQNKEAPAGHSSRHRSGDVVRVARKAGFLEVRRYGPEYRH